jgi:hypothetical protein
VGRLLKSKCLEISGKACSDKAAVALLTLGWAARIAAVDQHERSKAYPDRYPCNRDSLGIELVGKSLDKQTYEPVTAGARVLSHGASDHESRAARPLCARPLLRRRSGSLSRSLVHVRDPRRRYGDHHL